jgi:hypothetical protein
LSHLGLQIAVGKAGAEAEEQSGDCAAGRDGKGNDDEVESGVRANIKAWW